MNNDTKEGYTRNTYTEEIIKVFEDIWRDILDRNICWFDFVNEHFIGVYLVSDL